MAPVEDLLGGAIIYFLDSRCSPEAEAAAAVFEKQRNGLEINLKNCCSGRQIAELGFERDIPLAAELNGCGVVPVLYQVAYRKAQDG